MPINQEEMKNNAKGNRPIVKWQEPANAIADLKSTFGFLPSFVDALTEQSIPGAWNEAKQLRFSTGTSLDTKTKGLIALGVATQIPCEHLIYFEKKATLQDGASKQELQETVLMSAITRHWSTVLNGSQLDFNEFKKEADKVMEHVKKMMEEMHGQTPSEEMFLFKPTTASDAYKDIEKMFGLIPKFFLLFPREAIAGAWSEFKAVQMNPHSALSGKQKELIGLGVAAQIPCNYCVYFHRSAAILNGASDREIQEAISIAALTRHWSAIFHGPLVENFKKDADQMIKNTSQRQLQ